MDEARIGNEQMTGTISRVKREVGLVVWAERVKECQSSGLAVAEYCRRNGINIKTYYYHLRKLREQLCSELEEQAPVQIGELPSTDRPASVTLHDGSGITDRKSTR